MNTNQRLLILILGAFLVLEKTDGFQQLSPQKGTPEKSTHHDVLFARRNQASTALQLTGVSETADLLLSPLESSSITLSSVAVGISTAKELGILPFVAMLGSTLLGLRISTPPNVVGALQHFAAGILLSAVSLELLPEMVNAAGWEENIASGVGFFAGVATLIILGLVFPEQGEEELDVTTIAISDTSVENS